MRVLLHRFTLPLFALTLALALAACGGSAGDSSETPSEMDMSEGDESESAAGEATLNEADVTFLQNMIPHHQQATEMAELVADRSDRPELQQMAEDIISSQTMEIDQMRGLLEAAGEDPDAMEGMDMSSMPGGMDESRMAELEELSGQEYDLAFIDAMSEHHEGAITMAETVIAEGENPEVAELARTIIEAQRAEIDQMDQWRQEWA